MSIPDNGAAKRRHRRRQWQRSGLNNLTNITLDPCYSAICGYTEGDLDAVFKPELPGLDRGEVRRWYNGYSWLGKD